MRSFSFGNHGAVTTPCIERLERLGVRRVCDHTGQCGGGGVANLWLGDHTIIAIITM